MQEPRHTHAGSRSLSFLLAGALVALLAAPASADSNSYNDDASNPLRILSYILHPVGVLLDRAIVRPLAQVGEVIAPRFELDLKGGEGCRRARPDRRCVIGND